MQKLCLQFAISLMFVSGFCSVIAALFVDEHAGLYTGQGLLLVAMARNMVGKP